MSKQHHILTATDLHVPGYQQTGDPGAIGAGKLWVDTNLGTGSWLPKVRNDLNTGWETLSSSISNYWTTDSAQTGLTGDKTGSFNLTTTGEIRSRGILIGSGTDNYVAPGAPGYNLIIYRAESMAINDYMTLGINSSRQFIWSGYADFIIGPQFQGASETGKAMTVIGGIGGQSGSAAGGPLNLYGGPAGGFSGGAMDGGDVNIRGGTGIFGGVGGKTVITGLTNFTGITGGVDFGSNAVTTTGTLGAGAITGTSLKATGLTATRIPIVGTGGLLGDSSYLTFVGGVLYIGGAGTSDTTHPGFIFTRDGTTNKTHFQEYNAGFSYLSQNLYRDYSTGYWYQDLATDNSAGMLFGTDLTWGKGEIIFFAVPANMPANSVVETYTKMKVCTTGVAIGLTYTYPYTQEPSAKLHLGAGTATAGTASLKIDSGVLLNTTEAGVMENDGTHLYFTFANSGTRYQLDQQSGSGITSLNGLTGATQTFAIPGTTGTAPAWSSATTIHTLNIPMASAAGVTAGLLSKADYDIFNAKQAAITGTDTYVMFFDGANTPAGDAGFVYNKTTNTATLDGIVLKGITSDPGSPADGTLWQRSDLKELRYREDGITYKFILERV